MCGEGDIQADRGKNTAGVTVERYIELIRRDYKVYIGKVGETEADFAAERPDGRLYVQVTESMLAPGTREREPRPLRMIRDSYEKIVLSMDRSFIASYGGIKTLFLPGRFLGKQD